MSLATEHIVLQEGKKIYFASDFHFGIPDYEATRLRETRVCQWLDSIKHDAQQVYLLGDLFDSWMEYKRVVPKGTVRFLGKLAELSDMGIDVIVFTGNHDLWMHGYFEKELNVRVHKSAQNVEIGDKLFHLAHGDGVAKEDKKYRLLKMKSPDQEYQLLYANDLLQRNRYDYFIFGHRHIPCLLKLNADATFINIGDWITFNTYAVFDGSETLLVKY